MQLILGENIQLEFFKDESVFREVYRQSFVKLYRFAFSFLHSKEAAEEIVHDVLINLWKKRNDFTDIQNLDTYLYVSVKNLSLNYLRNEAKHAHKDIDEMYDEMAFISINPESICIAKESADRLNKSINNLPVKCRLIFKLIKLDGLKYKEVAILLNISVKTVENQLANALKKIAFTIQKY